MSILKSREAIEKGNTLIAETKNMLGIEDTCSFKYLDTVITCQQGETLVQYRGNTVARLYGCEKQADKAKLFACLYFMLLRPEKFASSLIQRLIAKRGVRLEYYRFKLAVKEANMEFPPELTPDMTDGEGFLLFNGQLV